MNPIGKLTTDFLSALQEMQVKLETDYCYETEIGARDTLASQIQEVDELVDALKDLGYGGKK